MRGILLLFPSLIAALSGCGGRDIESELNATTGELQTVRARLRQEEERRAAAEAFNNELRARGNPISSLRLLVTVECAAPPGQGPAEIRSAGTVVALIGRDGSRWRLIDDMAAPPQVALLESGAYAVTFTYRPEDERSILGQDIEALRNVGGLGIRYASVLALIGLQMTPAGVTRVQLEVNGLSVLDAQGVGVPSGSGEDGFEPVDMARHFETVPERYFAGLRQRAQARLPR